MQNQLPRTCKWPAICAKTGLSEKKKLCKRDERNLVRKRRQRRTRSALLVQARGKKGRGVSPSVYLRHVCIRYRGTQDGGNTLTVAKIRLDKLKESENDAVMSVYSDVFGIPMTTSRLKIRRPVRRRKRRRPNWRRLKRPCGVSAWGGVVRRIKRG